MTTQIETLRPADSANVAALLCDAFANYPVMRFVLGEQPDYAARLTLLIDLFTAGRWLREHPVLGLRAPDGTLQGVITLTPRGTSTTPPELTALTDSTWTSLGADAQQRYALLREAWTATEPEGEHWHVNMLGTITGLRGAGVGGRLLAAARVLAEADPAVQGVDLTTEDPANLDFYTRRGFQVTSHRRVGSTIETWTLVAPRNAANSTS